MDQGERSPEVSLISKSKNFGCFPGTDYYPERPINSDLVSLVKNVFPALLASQICGVQPMSEPTGLIFAMRDKYIGEGYKPGSKYKDRILYNIEIMKRKPILLEYIDVPSGYRRELNVFKQKDGIEFVKDN